MRNWHTNGNSVDWGCGMPPEDLQHAGMIAVSTAFGSLGRVCLTLTEDFRVRSVSNGLDDLVGVGAARALADKLVEGFLGAELFGPGGTLRSALQAGEKREGWRASLRVEPAGSRLVSVTAAPLKHDGAGVCDPEARYLVVLRPAEEEEMGTSPSALVGFGGVIARSPAMLRVFRLIENLQHSEATVLLSGESGTGKEVVARAIHAHSPRRDGPFVAVNCAAIPADLLESELFGHVKGAFTGAIRDRIGRFELATGGTLFLDEIGEMPLLLQAKLLRVLQERSFERVGDSRTLQSNARVIAATNVDLRRAVEHGQFREDLFYRLRVVPIELAPLRDRLEDVEPLARYLLGRAGERNGRAVRLSPDALRTLLRYQWPGNVRELENALEFALAVCKGQTLQPEDLPPELASSGRKSPASVSSVSATDPVHRLPDNESKTADDPERERIRTVLDEHHWNRSTAAAALGVSRSTLWRKMRELRLAR